MVNDRASAAQGLVIVIVKVAELAVVAVLSSVPYTLIVWVPTSLMSVVLIEKVDVPAV